MDVRYVEGGAHLEWITVCFLFLLPWGSGALGLWGSSQASALEKNLKVSLYLTQLPTKMATPITLSQVLALPEVLLFQALELKRDKEWKNLSQDKLEKWESDLNQLFTDYNRRYVYVEASKKIEEAFAVIESQGLSTPKTEEVRKEVKSALELADIQNQKEIPVLEASRIASHVEVIMNEIIQKSNSRTLSPRKERKYPLMTLRSGKTIKYSTR